MKTSRDPQTLKTQLEVVYEESFRKARHESNVAAGWLFVVTILAGLGGFFILGPFLMAL